MSSYYEQNNSSKRHNSSNRSSIQPNNRQHYRGQSDSSQYHQHQQQQNNNNQSFSDNNSIVDDSTFNNSFDNDNNDNSFNNITFDNSFGYDNSHDGDSTSDFTSFSSQNNAAVNTNLQIAKKKLHKEVQALVNNHLDKRVNIQINDNIIQQMTIYECYIIQQNHQSNFDSSPKPSIIMMKSIYEVLSHERDLLVTAAEESRVKIEQVLDVELVPELLPLYGLNGTIANNGLHGYFLVSQGDEGGDDDYDNSNQVSINLHDQVTNERVRVRELEEQVRRLEDQVSSERERGRQLASERVRVHELEEQVRRLEDQVSSEGERGRQLQGQYNASIQRANNITAQLNRVQVQLASSNVEKERLHGENVGLRREKDILSGGEVGTAE